MHCTKHVPSFMIKGFIPLPTEEHVDEYLTKKFVHGFTKEVKKNNYIIYRKKIQPEKNETEKQMQHTQNDDQMQHTQNDDQTVTAKPSKKPRLVSPLKQQNSTNKKVGELLVEEPTTNMDLDTSELAKLFLHKVDDAAKKSNVEARVYVTQFDQAFDNFDAPQQKPFALQIFQTQKDQPYWSFKPKTFSHVIHLITEQNENIKKLFNPKIFGLTTLPMRDMKSGKMNRHISFIKEIKNKSKFTMIGLSGILLGMLQTMKSSLKLEKSSKQSKTQF